MDYPDSDQLRTIYTAYLDAAISKSCPRTNPQQLASTMVSAYEVLRKTFSVDQQSHYLFTPRDLTQWLLGLLRYDLNDDNILEIWYTAQKFP